MTGRLQGIQGQGVRHRRRTQVRSIQLALSTRQAQEEAPDAPRHHQAPEPAGPLARAPARERAPRAAPRRAVHRNAGASASGGPRHRRPRRHWLLAGPSIPPRAPGGGGTGGSAAPVGRWPGCVFRGRARSPRARLGSPTGRGRVLRAADATSRAARARTARRARAFRTYTATAPRSEPGRCACVPCQALRCVVCSLSLVFIVPPARTPK